MIWIIFFAIITIILIGLAIYAIMIFLKMKRNKHKTDYLALFVFSLIWIITTVIMKRYALSIIGIIIGAIGLNQRKNWKKNRMNWKKMKPSEEKEHLMLMLILLAVLTIAGSIWGLSKTLS